MQQKFPGIPVKARKREYLKGIPFVEIIPPGWTVPFEFFPENPIQMVSAPDLKIHTFHLDTTVTIGNPINNEQFSDYLNAKFHNFNNDIQRQENMWSKF